MFAPSSSGTSAPRPAAHFGSPTRSNSTLIRARESAPTPTWPCSATLRTNGCAAARCAQWVPKAYADEPIYVFETGGSTGLPKYRINIRDFQTDYALYSESLSEDGFPRGG